MNHDNPNRIEIHENPLEGSMLRYEALITVLEELPTTLVGKPYKYVREKFSRKFLEYLDNMKAENPLHNPRRLGGYRANDLEYTLKNGLGVIVDESISPELHSGKCEDLSSNHLDFIFTAKGNIGAIKDFSKNLGESYTKVFLLLTNVKVTK